MATAGHLLAGVLLLLLTCVALRYAAAAAQ